MDGWSVWSVRPMWHMWFCDGAGKCKGENTKNRSYNSNFWHHFDPCHIPVAYATSAPHYATWPLSFTATWNLVAKQTLRCNIQLMCAATFCLGRHMPVSLANTADLRSQASWTTGHYHSHLFFNCRQPLAHRRSHRKKHGSRGSKLSRLGCGPRVARLADYRRHLQIPRRLRRASRGTGLH